MFSFLKFLKSPPLEMQKFLIVGLGNIGQDYEHTRHNIGFEVLDTLAAQREITFEPVKSALKTQFNFKGKTFVLLKPTTLMNRSGKAVRYWALKENIPLQNIFVITDDLHLPFGSVRIRTKGSAGGHNGLKDVEQQLNTPHYCRMRFGIGQEHGHGNQVDFVLGKWTTEESTQLKARLEHCAAAVISFGLQGVEKTMNAYNGPAT
jgi:PTH1 family peptidyl-tRNA hydrolase